MRLWVLGKTRIQPLAPSTRDPPPGLQPPPLLLPPRRLVGRCEAAMEGVAVGLEPPPQYGVAHLRHEPGHEAQVVDGGEINQSNSPTPIGASVLEILEQTTLYIFFCRENLLRGNLVCSECWRGR